jgi:hypothetical protein
MSLHLKPTMSKNHISPPQRQKQPDNHRSPLFTSGDSCPSIVATAGHSVPVGGAAYMDHPRPGQQPFCFFMTVGRSGCQKARHARVLALLHSPANLRGPLSDRASPTKNRPAPLQNSENHSPGLSHSLLDHHSRSRVAAASGQFTTMRFVTGDRIEPRARAPLPKKKAARSQSRQIVEISYQTRPRVAGGKISKVRSTGL